MKSWFTFVKPVTNPYAGVGGACSCQAQVKLELEVNASELDALEAAGFATVDNWPGSCPTCGRPYKSYRLAISGVTQLQG